MKKLLGRSKLTACILISGSKLNQGRMKGIKLDKFFKREINLLKRKM